MGRGILEFDSPIVTANDKVFGPGGGAAVPYTDPAFLGTIIEGQYINAGQTVAYPLGFTAQAGDFIIGCASSDGANNYTSGVGFVGGVDVARESYGVTHQVSYLVCAGGETEVSVKGGVSYGLVWSVQAWRGIDPDKPIAVDWVKANSTSGVPNPPSLTVPNPPVLRFITGSLDDDHVTFIPPDGFSNESKGFGGNGSQMIASALDITGGALNPGAFQGGGNDYWVALHFACHLKL